jgi:phosphoribosylformylglycinamidine (FGAM) synthase-like amidotransferase family enzyme
MKMREIVIALVVLAAGIAMNAAPARAQGTAVDTSSPIVVKQKAVKPVWLKAEVIHADQLSIMVRDEANGMNVHTFTYSDKARERMQAVLEAGGFQYGDKIKIRYLPGKTEALEIRGEPSKPI